MKTLVVSLFSFGLVFWAGACAWLNAYNEVDFAERSVIASWARIEDLYQIRTKQIVDLAEDISDYLGVDNQLCGEALDLQSQGFESSFRPIDLAKNLDQRAAFLNQQRDLAKVKDRLLEWADQYPELQLDLKYKILLARLETNESFLTGAVVDNEFITKSYNQNLNRWLTGLVAKNYGFRIRVSFSASP